MSTLREVVLGRLRHQRSSKSRDEIVTLLQFSDYIQYLNETEISTKTIHDLNEYAKTALQLSSLFDDVDVAYLWQVLGHFRTLIKHCLEQCRAHPIQKFDVAKHSICKAAKIPKVFLEKFERVKVRDDSIWALASVALFGDCAAACDVIRLLTLATLLTFEDELKRHFQSYSDGNLRILGPQTRTGTYEEVLTAILEVDFCFGYWHLMAVSMATRKPIYLYGSFEQFRKDASPPEGATGSPYEVAKAVYEDFDSIGHYRYCGFEEDDNGWKEPIGIYFDGKVVHCAVLPREGGTSMPWRPKSLAGPYLSPRPNSAPSSNSGPRTNSGSGPQSSSGPNSNISKEVVRNASAEVTEANDGDDSDTSLDLDSDLFAGLVGVRLLAMAVENMQLKKAIANSLAEVEEDKEVPSLEPKSEEKTCPKCRQETKEDIETCMGICDRCDYIYCVLCRNAYHGNNSTDTCESQRPQHQTGTSRTRRLLMEALGADGGSQAEELAGAQSGTKSETKAGTKSGTQPRTQPRTKVMTNSEAKVESKSGTQAGSGSGAESGTQSGPESGTQSGPEFGTQLGSNRLSCKDCERRLAKVCEREERWSLVLNVTYSYWLCRCGFWRISNKEIERWLQRDRVGLKSLERAKFVVAKLPEKEKPFLFF